MAAWLNTWNSAARRSDGVGFACCCKQVLSAPRRERITAAGGTAHGITMVPTGWIATFPILPRICAWLTPGALSTCLQQAREIRLRRCGAPLRFHVVQPGRHLFLREHVLGHFGSAERHVFTRLFDPHDYGIYVLGMAFAIVLNTSLTSWLRLPISERERAAATAPTCAVSSSRLGAVLHCGPARLPAALLAGLTKDAAVAATAVALMMGVFEVGLEILRSQLQVLTYAKATVIRAIVVSVFGISVGVFDSHGVVLLCSTAWPTASASCSLSRRSGAARRYPLTATVCSRC